MTPEDADLDAWLNWYERPSGALFITGELHAHMTEQPAENHRP